MKTQPIFLSFENPLFDPDRKTFSHFEIQNVREYCDHDLVPFMEVITDEENMEPDAEGASGPVLFGVYGRTQNEGAQSIADFTSLDSAVEFLNRIGLRICTSCNGDGHDHRHLWPDGSLAACEACLGYGESQPTT